MAPRDRWEGDGVLEKLHNWVYPPDSKYFWYRRGKVKKSSLGRKYLQFALMSLFVAMAGSGTLMFIMTYALVFAMKEWHLYKHGGLDAVLAQNLTGSSLVSGPLADELSADTYAALQGETDAYMKELCADPVFIVSWMFMAGVSTLVLYYLGAASIHNEFYVRRRDEAEQWKVQPKRFPSPELFLEEKLTGCWNGFVSGALGTGLFFLHQNYPLFKFYYTTGVRGFGHYILGCVLVYVWVDFMSYWIHRTLHHKYVYKYVHKWHHRYKAPTAFGAYAIHPIEYAAFQSAGIWCSAIFPVHVMSFLTVVVYVAYHNQIDHSGVDFEGELPWVPSTEYHDNHHEHFHLNYGVTLIVWDWLFGTLRQIDRKYGEDIFEGEQDIVDTSSTKKFN